jgi:uncharacterized membrane protein YgcG
MKKGFAMITGLVLLVLGLAACSATGTAATSTAVVNGLNTEYQNALPVEMQLALGTLKLKGTENEVDAQTAEQLIPLWEAVQSLSNKNGSSPQEIQALYKQIGDTMTPAQVQAIAGMQLTQQDIPQIAQELGLDMAAGRSFNQGARPTGQAPSTNGQSGRNFSGGGGGGFGGNGGFPGGGFGGDGGFPGGGGFGRAQQTPNPSARATAQARFANGGGGFNRLSSVWVDAVIKYLQSITQS